MSHPIPLSADAALARYFYAMRHKLLDIAAGLDRIQRCAGGEQALRDDYRLVALRKAVEELKSEDLGRAERVSLIFSDPTTEPIPAATDGKAHGAWKPTVESPR
jgi:hypothetical protein